MKKTLLVFSAILCLAGCKRYDIDEILLQREDISLTVKGEDILSYDPATFQIGYNEGTNEFRIFEDNLGNWFTFKCQERPSSKEQVVKADLRWTTPNTTRSRKGLSFRVVKTDAKGHIWLWCEDEAIGVVVREL